MLQTTARGRAILCKGKDATPCPYSALLRDEVGSAKEPP